MKFRKKPVVIEAQQVTNGNGEDLARWCGGTFHGTEKLGYTACINIPTLEGTMRAEVGDWIIRGVNGEFYPCKPDIFAKTYDPVVEGIQDQYELDKTASPGQRIADAVERYVEARERWQMTHAGSDGDDLREARAALAREIDKALRAAANGR